MGPPFQIAISIAQLLAVLFFGMTFASGLPILMPIACVMFIVHFWVDKLMLCRYNRRPPHVNESAIVITLRLLPLAALIRLGVACWMYSSPLIFAEQPVSPTSTAAVQPYLRFVSMVQREAESNASIASRIIYRIFQRNVFPLFALFIVIILIQLLYFIWTWLQVNWIYRIFAYCFCRDRIDKKVVIEEGNEKIHPWTIHNMEDPLRPESAGYSRLYYKYVKNKNEIPNTCYQMITYDIEPDLNEEEKDQGWMLEEDKGYVMKFLPFHEDDDKPDRYKFTYEFISDHAVNSYALSRIPEYHQSILALTQNTVALLGEDRMDDLVTTKPIQYGGHHDDMIEQEMQVLKGKLTGADTSEQAGRDVEDEVARLKERLKTANETKNKKKKKKTKVAPESAEDYIDVRDNV